MTAFGTFGNFMFAGGLVPYGKGQAPVDPAEPVKVEPPLPRDVVSVAYPWLGFEKAPPASDGVFFRMRRHPTCELAFAITTAPIFAGTRAATIRNADGTTAAASGTPTGIGVQVTETPEEKRKKALDDLFEDQWPDVLVGLECYNFGRWTQEVVWDRKADTIAPVRFKSFLPGEVELQRDKFNDFAGFKRGPIERDARYAFHAVCRPHFDPIFGLARAESARESWWRSLQCHENGDSIEKKASGVQMAIGIMSGMTFRDAAGAAITAEDSILRIKNAAATGATWTYPLLAFDKASVQANPELAKLPAMKVDQFDWGDTGGALVAAISRLDRLDKEILRAWCRPEREAMEGIHGTKAEAGVHGAIGTIDSERVHSDFLRQLNRQVVNRWLVTNFGPDAADTIYFKAAPLADPQQAFKQQVAQAMLNSPTAGPQMQANVDGRRLLKDTELPLVPLDQVPQVVPVEEPEEQPGNDDAFDDGEDELQLSAGKPKDGDGDGTYSPGKGQPDSTPIQKKSKEKVKAAKGNASYVGKDIQNYARANEAEFAKSTNGLSYEDSEPADVVIGDRGVVQHGCEVKTLVSNKASKLTMDRYSQVRKVEFARANSAEFHTVVIDDRNVYNAGGAGKHDPSQRTYYYRRGIAGSARLESLHKTKSLGEVKSLMAAKESSLPEGAKRTDQNVRAGRWKAFSDAKGKGFRNSKTGDVVRAKK